jgi:serine/threonine protein kinase
LKTRIKFLREATNGLCYLHLHQPPIVHCDLKSANILVSGTLVCKLADFGFTTLKKSEAVELRGDKIGTALYSAPECLLGEYYNEKSDIFSLGIISFELLFRVFPAYGPPIMALSLDAFCDAIIGGQRPECPPDTPKVLRDFIYGMLRTINDHRPSALDVVSMIDKTFVSKIV